MVHVVTKRWLKGDDLFYIFGFGWNSGSASDNSYHIIMTWQKCINAIIAYNHTRRSCLEDFFIYQRNKLTFFLNDTDHPFQYTVVSTATPLALVTPERIYICRCKARHIVIFTILVICLNIESVINFFIKVNILQKSELTKVAICRL